MASRLRHSTVGFTVSGNIEMLERANKLLNVMPDKAKRVTEAFKSFKVDSKASKFFTQMSKEAGDAADKVSEGSEKANRAMQRMSASASDNADKASQALKKFSATWKDVGGDKQVTLKANVDQGQMSKALEQIKGHLKDQKVQIKADTEPATSSLGKFQDRAKLVFNHASDYAKNMANNGMTKARDKLRDLNETTTQSGHLFSKIFTSTLVSNAILSSWTSLTNGIKGAAKAGWDYAKAQDQMTATWTTLTGSANQAKSMKNEINNFSVETGQDANLVNEEEQGFYHLHSNRKESRNMTHALLNMTDAVGLNSQQANTVGQDMVHSLSAGKIQGGDLNVVGQYFPMFREALAQELTREAKNGKTVFQRKVTDANGKTHTEKLKKVTTEDLPALAKGGNIDSEEFEKTFEHLGNVKYSTAAEHMLSTFNGMERTIHSRVPALMDELEKPFMKQTSGLYGAISKWVSAPKTEKEFKQLGKAANEGIQTIATAFGKAYNIKNGPKFLDQVMSGLTKGVTSFSKAIAKHADDIKTFFSATKDISGATIKVFTQALKDLLPVLKAMGNMAASHPKFFGVIVAGIISINVATNLFRHSLGLLVRSLTPLLGKDGKGGLLGALGKSGGKSNLFQKLLPGDTPKARLANVFRKPTKDMSMVGKVGTVAAGVGIAADSGWDFYKALKAKNSLKKYKDFGKSIGTAVGGGVGFFFGGPAGAAVGSMIGHVVGGWAGKAVHAFSKTKMGHQIGKAFESVGPSVRKSFKGVSKTFSSVWSSVKKSSLSAGRSIGKQLKPLARFYRIYLSSALSTSVKVMGHILSGAIKVVGHMVSGIAGELKGMVKVFGSTVSLISDIFHGRWKKIWSDAKGIFSGFKTMVVSAVHTIGNVFSDVFNGIKHVIGDVGKGISGFWKKLTSHGSKNKKFATGTPSRYPHGLPQDTNAIVNDGGGQEVIQLPNGASFMLRGTRRKVFLPKGTDIYTAADSARIKQNKKVQAFAVGTKKLVRGKSNQLSVSVAPIKMGDFGKVERDTKNTVGRIGKTISGTYNDSISKSHKSLSKFGKQSDRTWNSMERGTKSHTNSIQKNTVGDFDQMQRHSTLQVDQLHKGINGGLKDILSDGKRSTQKFQSNTVGDFDDAQKGAVTQMNQMRSGVMKRAKDMVSDFGSVISHLDNYAHSAMSSAINQLNKGFSSINSVLGQFGGGKSVLKMAHYATGTQNGPIKQHMFGVVNDAKTGPRQELIAKKDGRLIAPHGRDVVMPLEPGDEIFSGHEVEYGQRRGLLPHFAKGTGKKSNGLLKSLIRRNDKNPAKAFADDFISKIVFDGSALQKSIANTEKIVSSKLGNPWNKAGWGALADAMSGGGSAAGGNWRHTPGLRETDPFGASRAGMYGAGAKHDGVDFSGALGAAIRAIHGGKVIKTGGTGISDLGKVIIVKSSDGFQEIYQEFGGMKNIKVAVGDIIHTGQRIATLGSLLGAGSGSHVHIGVTKGNPLHKNMLSTAGWYDVTKMHGGSNGSPKKASKQSPLSKLVSKQLSSQIKWVEKHLAPKEGDAGGQLGNPGGAGVTQWKKYIVKALKANGFSAAGSEISAWLQVIKRESGGNAQARQPGRDPDGDGSGPALGLVQTKRGTFDAYKFSGHDRIFNGYDDLLAGINYAKHRYGRGASMFSRVASKGYVNGGWSNMPAIFGEVPGEPEVAINPRRNSADHLIMSAINSRARFSKGGVIASLKKALTAKKDAKKRKSLTASIMQSLRAETTNQQHSNSRTTQQPVVIKPTLNFYGPVSRETADYASQKTSSEIRKIVREELSRNNRITIDEVFGD